MATCDGHTYVWSDKVGLGLLLSLQVHLLICFGSLPACWTPSLCDSQLVPFEKESLGRNDTYSCVQLKPYDGKTGIMDAAAVIVVISLILAVEVVRERVVGFWSASIDMAVAVIEGVQPGAGCVV